MERILSADHNTWNRHDPVFDHLISISEWTGSKTQVEMVISSVPVMDVINATRKALYTGHIGDGKIFVYDVEDVVKVRTGESGYDALQGEDD